MRQINATHSDDNNSKTNNSVITEKPRCRVRHFWPKVEDYISAACVFRRETPDYLSTKSVAS